MTTKELTEEITKLHQMIDFLRRSWTDQNHLLHEVIEKQDKEIKELKQAIEMLRRWRG